MTVEQELRQVVSALPPDRQQAILDFARSLEAKSFSERPRKPLRGICKDLAISITARELADVRREMWRGFPRDLPE